MNGWETFQGFKLGTRERTKMHTKQRDATQNSETQNSEAQNSEAQNNET
jgi:hypothetical protein